MRAKVTGQGEHETQQRRVCGLEIQMTHQHRLLKKSKMQNTLKMQAGQKRKKKLRRNEQILKSRTETRSLEDQTSKVALALSALWTCWH